MTIDRSRVVLRPSTDRDVGFVAATAETCMRAYVEAVGETWDALLPRRRFVAGRYNIVQLDAQDIGCMDVVAEADHLRLNNLYLLPQAQRRGIGTLLLTDLITEANEKRQPLRLRVLRSNPAQRFYLRLGFVVTGEIPGRYYMERAWQNPA